MAKQKGIFLMRMVDNDSSFYKLCLQYHCLLCFTYCWHIRLLVFDLLMPFISMFSRMSGLPGGFGVTVDPSRVVDLDTSHVVDPPSQDHPKKSEGAPRTSKKVPLHK